MADNSITHQEDEILKETLREPSSLPWILPSAESACCLPKTYETPERGQSVQWQRQPGHVELRQGFHSHEWQISWGKYKTLPGNVKGFRKSSIGYKKRSPLQGRRQNRHHCWWRKQTQQSSSCELISLWAFKKKSHHLLMSYLQQKVEKNNERDLFIQSNSELFRVKTKGRWREKTVREYVLWHDKSPPGYRFFGTLVSWPCQVAEPSSDTNAHVLKRWCPLLWNSVFMRRRNWTLRRYTIYVLPSLLSRVNLLEPCSFRFLQARRGSLVMDEMSLKQSALHQKQSGAVHGFVDLGGAEVDYGLEEQLATNLLCFVFVGLSTHYRNVKYLATPRSCPVNLCGPYFFQLFK